MKTNNLDQLRSEKAEAERKRDQAQRQANRYANQIEYVQKRSRKERTHHLCIIGGTVESIAPIFKDLTEPEILSLMGQIFELPQVQTLLRRREVKPDGSWGQKQRREYLLDENGQRIKDDAGHDKFNAVPTTDWGDPETLEFWREKWAELCNAKFEEKGLTERIDHRSYERQGIRKIPTIHEGPAVRAMERRGIRTEKGDFNRWVRATNKMMELVQEHLETLTDWISILQTELDAPRPKSLAEVMNAYYDQRNAGAYSQRAKVNNLKEMRQMLLYLQENNIATLDDAQLMVQEYNATFAGMQSDLKSKGERLKELRKLLSHADTVIQLRPIYGEYRNIRFEKQKAKFKAEHELELRKYFASQRELEKAFPEVSFDRSALEMELAQLEAEYDEAYAQFRELRSGSDQMWKLKRILEADDRQNPSRYVAQGK